MSSSSDAALLQEIQRLSGAIDRHKYSESKPHGAASFRSRHSYVNPAIANRTYVNPAIANKRYVNPSLANKSHMGSVPAGQPPSSDTRELVIDGVTFESSRRKLTRKDLINKPEASGSVGSATTPSLTARRPRPPYVRKGGNLVAPARVHKPTFSKRKRLAGRNNIVLDNVKGTRTGHVPKRRKVDKQCRFFTMTGTCQRGLTCPYQHDPERIAICSQFLTHSCPNTAETCHLSHDPTPARVPLCHHFANHGRCTRENCPYPHVRVGPRHGVCRDFAVVGYCEKGIECDQQHVRECPDFAEKGTCPNSACKLPHVIRANRKRQLTNSTPQAQTEIQPSSTKPEFEDQQSSHSVVGEEKYSSNSSPAALPSVHEAEAMTGAAADYISLTFEESDDDVEDSEEDSEEEYDGTEKAMESDVD